METRIRKPFSAVNRCEVVHRWRHDVAGCGKQKGAVAVVFAVVAVGLIGMCGLALDLALVYNRKVEMRNVADAAALGAARKLNGTATGIDDCGGRCRSRRWRTQIQVWRQVDYLVCRIDQVQYIARPQCPMDRCRDGGRRPGSHFLRKDRHRPTRRRRRRPDFTDACTAPRIYDGGRQQRRDRWTYRH